MAIDSEADPDRPAPIKGRAVATTVYLLPEDHRRLRILCAEKEVSFQTLFMDALDRQLAADGHSPLERWNARRRR